MKWKLGDEATLSKTITEDDVRQFGAIVGDDNPVHFDAAFAKTTRFGRPIAHGMLGASIISALLANRMPGPGTIYLSQSLRFTNPVYPGDTVTAKAVVTRIREEKSILTLATTCTNQRGETVIEGEAVVLLEEADAR
jgi:3-hydroxybutyryl-CoA dehydratase